MKARNRGFGSSFRGVGVVSLSFFVSLSLFRETWRWCLGERDDKGDQYVQDNKRHQDRR